LTTHMKHILGASIFNKLLSLVSQSSISLIPSDKVLLVQEAVI
jgi:hypothetical protein